MNPEKAWQILMDNNITNPDGKKFFMEKSSAHEIYFFRLNGPLGTRAKIWCDNGKFFIDCTEENLTPQKEILVGKINKELEN